MKLMAFRSNFAVEKLCATAPGRPGHLGTSSASVDVHCSGFRHAVTSLATTEKDQ